MESKKRPTAKTYSVRVSLNAIRNINEITGYIAFINFQPENAIAVGEAIFNTIDRIQKYPLAFRECEEIRTKSKMYRRAICLSWLIIYRVVDFEILILGVIHSSRRPTAIKQLRKIK
jgi:plasmid stabilization system protein ParE